MADDTSKKPGKKPGDEVPAGTPQSGENTCRQCKGTGRLQDDPCPECGGSGKVVVLVGDA
jgi:DnaJ-class molecular chaperone